MVQTKDLRYLLGYRVKNSTETPTETQGPTIPQLRRVYGAKTANYDPKTPIYGHRLIQKSAILDRLI